MSNEAIEKIKAAETEAERIIAEARKSAAEIRKTAEDEAALNEAKARSAAALYAKKTAESAGEKSDKVITDGIEEARGNAKRTVSASEEKIHIASESVIRGIFEKWQ